MNDAQAKAREIARAICVEYRLSPERYERSGGEHPIIDVIVRHVAPALTASPAAAMREAAIIPPSPWRPIEEAPRDDTLFLAGIEGEERIMIVRGSVLVSMMDPKTPDHLQFPATHWMPLPPSPQPSREG